MARMCFRAFDGKVAIWEKPPSGDPMAPFNEPLKHMEYVRFHSDLQYLNSQLISTAMSINHTAVAGVTGTGYSVSNGGSASAGAQIASGQVVANEYVLYTHNLGYAPLFFALFNGTVISGGIGVQKAANQQRLVSAFSTTTQIKIRDVGISSAVALPAVTREYDVYIFKNLVADPLLPMFHVKLTNPGKRIIFGRGRISDSQITVRRTKPGDGVQLPFPVSRSVDVRNGDIRSLQADGTFTQLGSYNGTLFGFDFVPVSFG